MKHVKPYLSMFAIISMLGVSQAFADCGSDRTQALNIIQGLKAASAANSAKANDMSEQLARLVNNLSTQNCNSELLDVYRTMQREGVQAN